MTKSMTAFASKEAQHKDGLINWEIKSVNNRFLDINFRLPESLREYEIKFKEIAIKNLKRGKIDCALKCHVASDADNFFVNKKMALKLMQIARDFAQTKDSDTKINIIDILKWPGVLQAHNKIDEVLNTKIINLFEKTIAEFDKARMREGAAITKAVAKILVAIKAQINELKKHIPQIIAQQRTRLTERLQEINISINKDRLEQEMVLLLQKIDIQEEIDRLSIHVDEVRRIFTQNNEAIGRRLDFLMQELQREANTIAAKSISHNTTQIAVELKVLIEQIREQIQNVE